MSEVKRYDGKIKHVGNGGYVSYTDYAELKAQRDALAENEGYKQAFYEIAEILGVGARPDSPKNVFEQVIKPMLINLKKERVQLATENAALLIRLRNIIDIVSKADNRYCMCGESMDSHILGGCGSPIGMLDYHFGKLTEENPDTPATDAYLNSVRDSFVDEAIHALAASGAQSFGDCMVALNQLRAGELS